MTPRVRRILVLVGVSFVVLLFASTTESSRVWRSSLETGPADELSDVPLDTTPSDTLAIDEPGGGLGDSTIGEAASVIISTILLSLLAIWVVWAAIALRSYWRRKERYDVEPEPTFVALPDVAAAITDDASAQLDALATGSPRNAIVACWVRLEDAVATVGIERHPAETATELTTRVLRRYSGGRDSIDELSRLYREARFSRHDLGEPERTRAVTALHRLHVELGLVPVDTS